MNIKRERSARILIVEDEPMIAMDLELLLVEAGYEVAGATGKLQTALRIAGTETLHAAILDANLGNVSSAPVAIELSARGVPFVILSGYHADQQPEVLRAAPSLQKPTSPVQILEVMERLVAARRA